jgi:hypothetical protein
MLLSINQKKIDEQLANYPPLYVVSPCTLEIAAAPAPQFEFPEMRVNGTASGISPEVERYRDRVLLLRRQLIDRGERPAASPDELERIIDETRGR